jgi:hypothetical protein
MALTVTNSTQLLIEDGTSSDDQNRTIVDASSFLEQSGATVTIPDAATMTLSHNGVNELRLIWLYSTRNINIKLVPPGSTAAAVLYVTLVGGQPGLIPMEIASIQVNNTSGQDAVLTYKVVGTDSGGTPPPPAPNLSQNNTITGEIDVKVAGDGSDNAMDVAYEFNTAINKGMIKFTSLNADQDFDAKVPIDLPSNFSSFQGSAIQVQGLVDDIANASFSIQSIIDTVGVERTLAAPLTSSSATLATLTVPNTDSAITDGTFNATETLYVVIRVQGDTSDNISIWNRVKAFIDLT